MLRGPFRDRENFNVKRVPEERELEIKRGAVVSQPQKNTEQGVLHGEDRAVPKTVKRRGMTREKLERAKGTKRKGRRKKAWAKRPRLRERAWGGGGEEEIQNKASKAFK